MAVPAIDVKLERIIEIEQFLLQLSRGIVRGLLAEQGGKNLAFVVAQMLEDIAGKTPAAIGELGIGWHGGKLDQPLQLIGEQAQVVVFPEKLVDHVFSRSVLETGL